jgi:hypothetical protein
MQANLEVKEKIAFVSPVGLCKWRIIFPDI